MRVPRVSSCLAFALFWGWPSKRSIDFDFDSAILRAAFARLIIRNRLAFAESLSGDAAGLHAFLDNVVFHRVHSPFGKSLVIGFGADAVGMTGKVNFLVLVFIHEGNQTVQNSPCLRFDVA